MTENERAIIDTLFDRARQPHRSGQPVDADMFRYVQAHFRDHPETGYYLVRDILALQASVCALREVVARARVHFTEFQQSREMDYGGKAEVASGAPTAPRQEHGRDAQRPTQSAEPLAAPNASLTARHLQQRLNRSRNPQD